MCNKARTILHYAIVSILWSMTMFAYFYYFYYYEAQVFASVRILVLVYIAYLCLYYCNASLLSHHCRKKKIGRAAYISLAGYFVSANICGYGMWRSGTIFKQASFIFAANVVALSSYCVSKLYPTLRRCFVVPAAAPAQQEEDEEAGAGRRLAQEAGSLFRIQELPREFSFAEITSMTQDFGSMVGQGGSGQVFRGHLVTARRSP